MIEQIYVYYILCELCADGMSYVRRDGASEKLRSSVFATLLYANVSYVELYELEWNADAHELHISPKGQDRVVSCS